jgi:glutathione-regulated potassium-efflux system ancillary protein KefF
MKIINTEKINMKSNTNHFQKKRSKLRILTATLILALASLASAGFVQAAETGSNAKTGKTLVIASHPFPERSAINKALWEQVERMDGVIYRNLESLYGDDTSAIDIEAERKAHEGVDRVVYIYPIHWFNLTPMLKAYFNSVWFQWAPTALRGKEMLVVVTAGADEKDYSADGKIGLSMEEILAPMHASANYVGMSYLPPLIFLDVDKSRVTTYQKQLADRLNQHN